jgi:hypothetical protein
MEDHAIPGASSAQLIADPVPPIKAIVSRMALEECPPIAVETAVSQDIWRIAMAH